MATIAQRLHERYLTENNRFELPIALAAADSRYDLLTNQPYEYERLGDREFELCATFDTTAAPIAWANAICPYGWAG